MVSLKFFICALFLTVLSTQRVTSGLIIRQIADFNTNNTLDSQGLDNIEVYISLIGDEENTGFRDESNGFEQTELKQGLGVSKIYTLGKRLSGDNLIAHGVKALNFPTPHNVRVILTYPTRGVGSLVHYALIAVEQSNSNGRAYVVNGGLNQRHITIAVEAVAVTHFHLAASIYGQ